MAEEKLKILYLMQVLLEETDKAHPMNATQLCDRMMKDHGYSYNRKTIYADLRRLSTYGIKISHIKQGGGSGYYVQSRDFELPELYLIRQESLLLYYEYPCQLCILLYANC